MKPPPEDLLARAADARAAGTGWKAVAELVKRSEKTVRKWPLRYPDRWSAAMQLATRRTIDDAATEALRVLRILVCSDDDRLRCQAARLLIDQHLELIKIERRSAALAPPPPPTDAQIIADFVKGHSREQLIQLAAHLLNTRVPGCSGLRDLPALGGD